MKDFGKALARYVIVFNCSDGVDYKMTAKMFAGLAQTGAWACLDEFNRISVEVLSVVATQISEIMAAVKKRAKMFWFEGTRCTYQIRHTYVLSLTLVTVRTDYPDCLSIHRPIHAQHGTDTLFYPSQGQNIRLIPSCGVFVTMNPGYAGRAELPDNLKAIVRPVSMMVPDFSLIAEIMMFAEVFSSAKSLAKKMVAIMELSQQQLSKQDHYDYTLRSFVIPISRAAGAHKRVDPEGSEGSCWGFPKSRHAVYSPWPSTRVVTLPVKILLLVVVLLVLLVPVTLPAPLVTLPVTFTGALATVHTNPHSPTRD